MLHNVPWSLSLDNEILVNPSAFFGIILILKEQLSTIYDERMITMMKLPFPT